MNTNVKYSWKFVIIRKIFSGLNKNLNDQKTITLNVQTNNTAANSTETVTLRYCREEVLQSKTSEKVVPEIKVTDNSCKVSSSTAQNDGAKKPKTPAKTAIMKPSPVKKSVRIQAKKDGVIRSKETEAQLLSGFLVSFNSVLNSEVNDLTLVNHLDGIERKTALMMVEDFLSADIHTLPSADQIPESVFCQNLNEAFPDQQMNLDQVVDHKERGSNIRSPIFDQKSSNKTFSPSKSIQFDKSSQSFSPNFAARRRNELSPLNDLLRKSGYPTYLFYIWTRKFSVTKQ